jgi:predicted metal-dependent hydrolase
MKYHVETSPPADSRRPAPQEFPRMTFDWTQGPLAEGLHNYNGAEFFAAHEAWESVWLTAPQPEKTFLQGLIQVTVAFHHLQRNNSLGTTRLLQAALRKLEPYPPEFGGISVHLLCNDIRERLQTLTTVQPIPPLAPPRIQPQCL